MNIILKWAMVLVTVLMLDVIATPSAQAATFTTLYNFCSQTGCTDGLYPYTELIQATNGDFYGTTFTGGSSCGLCGTVFKITPSGTLTTLHNFDGTDGANVIAGLLQATNGDFYGTAFSGGTYGYGAVFKITPGGTLTTLYNFCGQTNCPDGLNPAAVLIQATNGDLYGTTYENLPNYHGTVFKITPSGKLTTLHNFDGTDGEGPNTVIQAADGDFYGTTYNGGAHHSAGTVFKMTPSGTLTRLHSFCSQGTLGHCSDGQAPEAGLTQATNGDFYGTAISGGTYGGGTVFKMTPSGTLTTLYNFCSAGSSSCTDGVEPYGQLIQGTDGDLYGTTRYGGANGDNGTIFKITPGGTLTTLHSFDGTDGQYLYTGLIQATNGNFYGTTNEGGTNSDGTVFRLSVGLGPFVETQTTTGVVGAAVKILGSDLTDATSVTFNGSAATFTVVSASEITTSVPTGATTGLVEVTTPGGTLKSNKNFRVTL